VVHRVFHVKRHAPEVMAHPLHFWSEATATVRNQNSVLDNTDDAHVAGISEPSAQFSVRLRGPRPPGLSRARSTHSCGLFLRSLTRSVRCEHPRGFT
jgi:hypothetical protein